MGDFVGGTLKYLRAHPVPKLTLAGGFGKLVKLAQGHLFLHSSKSRVDMAALAASFAELGASAEDVADGASSEHRGAGAVDRRGRWAAACRLHRPAGARRRAGDPRGRDGGRGHRLRSRRPPDRPRRLRWRRAAPPRRPLTPPLSHREREPAHFDPLPTGEVRAAASGPGLPPQAPADPRRHGRGGGVGAAARRRSSVVASMSSPRWPGACPTAPTCPDISA